MLTNRIAAALAAGLGLGVLLAVVMVLVWWNVSVRQKPLRVVDDAAALETLLESAPYIALNAGERPVYVIAPRSSPDLERWLSSDALQLAGQGRQVRVILLPSGSADPSDEATVTALWLDRDIDLLQEWMAMRPVQWKAIGLAPASQSPERLAVLAEARAFAHSLMPHLGLSGRDARWPLLVWRDGAGQLAACLCADAKAAGDARYALRISESATDHAVIPAAAAPRALTTDDDQDFEDVYPRLGHDDPDTEDPYLSALPEAVTRTPSPTLPGDAQEGATPPPAQRPQAPARPAPRPTVNTAPPVAQKDAEALFY